MSIDQFLVLTFLSAIATLPTVLLIPRARKSPVFDRVLWVATLVLGFLGGWYTMNNTNALPAPSRTWIIADVPLPAALIGALAGAVVLNGILWLMDRFASSANEPDFSDDAAKEENDERPKV